MWWQSCRLGCTKISNAGKENNFKQHEVPIFIFLSFIIYNSICGFTFACCVPIYIFWTFVVQFWEHLCKIWLWYIQLVLLGNNAILNLVLKTFNFEQHDETFVLLFYSPIFLLFFLLPKKYLFFFNLILCVCQTTNVIHVYVSIAHSLIYIYISLNTGLKNAKSKFGSFQIQ